MVANLATVVGAATGLVSGGAVGLFVGRRRPVRTELVRHQNDLEPEVEADVRRAAERWATDHDMPEAADLIVRNVRLSLALQAGRGRRMP